jgi:PPOX class probable F420-dependent enzyme
MAAAGYIVSYMIEMTNEEAFAFLSEGTRTGKLATVRADGRPHVTPIWFVVDGDDLVFNTWHTSAKAKHLARDPRVSLVVDLEEAPYAYVLVEGTVTISEDLDEITRFATRIGARYMGDDRAEEFGARNGVEGELLVRLHVDRLIALGDITQ